ncbi:galactosamine-6-phosphate isomerase [Maribacter algicola]|uniref:Galactosamine-6-phosphate isomerase n=1 Tax=Meishania litoralis TaxID=3434685 RepID=A0ACC7LQK6_9FLAO
MDFHYCSDYDEMSLQATDYLISELKKKSGQLLGVATGNSPLGVYRKLRSEINQHPKYFEKLRILKLDEWVGLKMSDPSSCESYIQNNILEPLKIPSQRYTGFQSDPEDLKAECDRVQATIERQGPIDLCILGLGRNGHIGFIEPAESFMPHCQIAELSKISREHAMVDTLKKKPTHGLTLGMGDVLASKKIILLVTGTGKESVVQALLKGHISTRMPASFLWLHPNVQCYLDKSSFSATK